MNGAFLKFKSSDWRRVHKFSFVGVVLFLLFSHGGKVAAYFGGLSLAVEMVSGSRPKCT
ncbi:MAG: hypothetical protein XD44_0363 [Methanobacteriaceae archaeon 41_258]|nr:MAG: hypothetical protein XD44_0363 [Methanobacteriaceae archaeon 41_258]